MPEQCNQIVFSNREFSIITQFANQKMMKHSINTFTQQRKLFVISINIQISIFPQSAAIFLFSGHFGSDTNCYKSETFLIPGKTFVDNVFA